MAADLSKVIGGPADVKLGVAGSEAVIGHTIGGIEATVGPQNRERVVDQYGSTAVAIIHTGDEVRITVPWGEWVTATLNEVYDPGTESAGGAGSFKGVGRSAGYTYTTQSMVVIPYVTADAGMKIQFYKTTPIGEFSMAFNNDDDRVLEVEYAALLDTGETDGHLLGRLFTGES
jgi:hypothetical protein